MQSKSSNQKIHFSRLTGLQPVINYFEKQGLPVQKYLRQAGISDSLMENLEKPIPKSLQWKFVTAACKDEEIDHIGLLVGREASVEELGEFGEFLLDSGTVGDYLTQGCRFINTMSSGEYYWLFEEADQLRFCVSISGLRENHKIQNYLYILLFTINTIRKATSESWCPTEVNVPAMKAGTAAKLAEHLPGTEISRHGVYASFLIPYAFLEKPLVQRPNPSTVPHESLPPDYKSSVIEVIKILIISGRPGLQNAVELSGVSSRTFQRKLKKMGVNYTELVLEARMSIARQWLENGDISITDISKALGYQTPSNFSRAFRGLVGQSPKAYRRRSA
jgi:AraC-like DNA-binding protein